MSAAKALVAFLFVVLAGAVTTAASSEESELNPVELLDKAYVEFRSGNSETSRLAAEQALSIGRSNKNPDVIGGALAALCRLALRDNDASAIDALTTEMHEVASSSGQEKWHVYAIHMRAELARMNGRLDEADKLYVESLELSTRIGLIGMVAAENFNRSFISVTRGDLESAKDQVREYFVVSAQRNDGSPGAYGLIALANLLAAREQHEQAAVVVFATHRIFGEQDIVPDPADAAPLQKTEALVRERLDPEALSAAQGLSRDMSVQLLIDEYL